MWYKALFQELLQQWSSHGNSVVALHKSRQGPLRQEGAEAALAQLKHCGRAFASLLTLNKVHLKRIQVGHLLFFTFGWREVDCRRDLIPSKLNAYVNTRLSFCFSTYVCTMHAIACCLLICMIHAIGMIITAGMIPNVDTKCWGGEVLSQDLRQPCS